MRDCQTRRIIPALLLIAILFAAGCPAGQDSADPASESNSTRQDGSAGSASADSEAAGTAPQISELRSNSLLNETPYIDNFPISLDIGRVGRYLFLNAMVRQPSEIASDVGQNIVQCFRFDAKGNVLIPEWSRRVEYARDDVFAHPSEDRCLALDSQRNDDGSLSEKIWEISGDRVTNIRYLEAEGLPANIPGDALLGLKPIYSWTGNDVVVPLKQYGMCVFNVENRKAKYIPFENVPAEFTGSRLAPLPQVEGRDLVFVSYWIAGVKNNERSWLAIYDIDDGTAVWQSEIPWVVYDIAGADLLRQPFLATGSRAPQTVLENKREPVLATIDPNSGNHTLLPFRGQPAWQVEMSQFGDYITYLDELRESVVSIKTDRGLLTQDPFWFDTEAKIFHVDGNDRVFLWKRNILIEANLKNEEKVEPIL